MSDALLSAPVAIAADVAAVTLLAVAVSKIKKDDRENIIPLMGVAGAFIFAAQMVNFAIPGTGSSGHIVGGVLLAALLGPWAAFVTLASVLIIQCLVFADGGLMALGCNIINMGAMSTLVAYPLLFRPLLRFPTKTWKIMLISTLACVGALEFGACMVSLETITSGITALPPMKFYLLMASIHLAIGVGEGIATGAVLTFVQKYRPDMLEPASPTQVRVKKGIKGPVIAFATAAVVVGGLISLLASDKPDGLEWSIGKVAGTTELAQQHVSAISEGAGAVQQTTSIMPDYNSGFAGIAGAAMVVVLVWGITAICCRRKLRPKTAEIDTKA